MATAILVPTTQLFDPYLIASHRPCVRATFAAEIPSSASPPDRVSDLRPEQMVAVARHDSVRRVRLTTRRHLIDAIEPATTYSPLCHASRQAIIAAAGAAIGPESVRNPRPTGSTVLAGQRQHRRRQSVVRGSQWYGRAIGELIRQTRGRHRLMWSR